MLAYWLNRPEFKLTTLRGYLEVFADVYKRQVASGASEEEIIEKIDIGGISLIGLPRSRLTPPKRRPCIATLRLSGATICS